MKLLIKFLFIVVIFALFTAIGISFALGIGKEVDITWTQEDFNSGLSKSKVTIDDIQKLNLENLARNNFSTSGTSEIDDFFTSEEISALVSTANDKSGPIRDVKISFKDDGKVETSFKLSDNFVDFLKEQKIIPSNLPWEVEAAEENVELAEGSSGATLTDMVVDYITNKANNKPVYATGELTRASDNSVDIKIEQLTVGRIPLPQEAIERVEYETVRVINAIISPENGFHIEELEVRENALFYKGTLPAEIEGTEL